MDKRHDEWIDSLVPILGGIVWMIVMLGFGLAVIRIVWWGFTGGLFLIL